MMSPDELQQLLAEAQAWHRSGHLPDAERAYLRLSQNVAPNPDLVHLLGILAFQQGNAPVAIDRYRQAISLRRDFPQAHNNLGIALKSMGRMDEAATFFAAALEAKPDYAEAAYNYAILHESRGSNDEAERTYRLALNAKPDWVEALGNLGNLLRKAARPFEAEPFLQRAATLAPTNADTLGNLALLRIDQGRLADARHLAERAAMLSPDAPQWWAAAGTAARHLNDFDAAAPLLERAAKLAPNDAALWLELGLALEACADDAGARSAIEKARQLAPEWERLRWTEALLLPRIVDDEAGVDAALRGFDRGLDALEAGLRLDTSAQREAAFNAASANIPFNMHYLPGDHTARQLRYSDLVAKCVRAALPDFASPVPPPPKTERMRIGFLCSHVQDHVVMRYFSDFIVKLDPAQFERFVWATSDVRDAVTEEIARKADRFTAGESTVARLAADIRAASLDVLVFLDAGLDPRSSALASLRLAATQAACYGHPVTTGFDSVDYFLSGELLETATSDTHYRERLVRLPGIGASVQAPPPAGDGSWLEALRAPGRPIVMCLQNLGKVPPSFDATIAQILAETGARLVFLNRGERLTRRFRARIDRALEARGVSKDAIHIEAMRTRTEFIGGIARADLVLDTPGFSGGATSLDALWAGTPIVTFEGESARGRQTSAMLKLIGLDELIAKDHGNYVRIAAGMLTDASAAAVARDRIKARSAALFGDSRVVDAFAKFLRDCL